MLKLIFVQGYFQGNEIFNIFEKIYVTENAKQFLELKAE